MLSYIDMFKAKVVSCCHIIHIESTWPESESELYKPSDRRLSAKLVPIFRIEGVTWLA
jgi:hypothetical protein